MTGPITMLLVQHVHGGGPSGPPPGRPLLSTFELYASVVAAGLLAAPTMTRVRPPRQVWATLAALSAAAAGGTAGAMIARGQVDVLRGAIVVLAAVAGAATARWGGRTDELATAGALLAVDITLIGLAAGATHLLLAGVHLLAAAIWVGGVVHLALVASSRSRRVLLALGIRRFSPYAVASAGSLAATGVVLAVHDHVDLTALRTTGFGQIVAAKSLLLLVAGVAGVAHRRPTTRAALRRRPVVLRLEATVLASALGLAVVLVGTPEPQAVSVPLAAGLVRVDEGSSGATALLAVATGAGHAIVEVVGDESLLVQDDVSGRAHQLGPAEAATFLLREGRVEVTVTSGQVARRVSLAPVPAIGPLTTTGRQAWLDYQLGRVLGGRSRVADARVTCPASFADPTRVLTRALTGSGISAVDVVRDVARPQRPRGRSVLLATSTPAAISFLHRIAGRPRAVRDVYLAPWLLDTRVLAAVSSLRLPPVTVLSALEPTSPAADRYRALLQLFAPGAPPSSAGLAGYLAAVGEPPGRLRLYAAEPVGFLPGVLDVGHDHGATGWVPGGALVPISRALTVPGAQCLSPLGPEPHDRTSRMENA